MTMQPDDKRARQREIDLAKLFSSQRENDRLIGEACRELGRLLKAQDELAASMRPITATKLIPLSIGSAKRISAGRVAQRFSLRLDI
jgi:hypothetical protein